MDFRKVSSAVSTVHAWALESLAAVHLSVLGAACAFALVPHTASSSLVTVPLSDELLKALLCSSPLCGGFPFKGGREAALLSGAVSLAGELATEAPALASAGGCSVSSEGPLRPASPPCIVFLH